MADILHTDFYADQVQAEMADLSRRLHHPLYSDPWPRAPDHARALS
jgi:hypothetical protein